MTNNIPKEEYAIKFNAGAAYANAHKNTNPNEVIGGMRYVFRQSEDLTEEPIIQGIVAESKAYLKINEAHAKKIREWEALPEETRGKEPTFEQPDGYFKAAHSYEQLIYSSDVRTKILSDNYGKLTVQQGIGIALGGQMPNSTPAKIKTAIAKNTRGLIKDIRSETLKKTMEAAMKFYILGETGRGVQYMYFEDSLEGIVNSGN